MSRWETCHSLHTLLYCLIIYQVHILSSKKKACQLELNYTALSNREKEELSKEESQWFLSLILLPAFFPWVTLSHGLSCHIMVPNLNIQSCVLWGIHTYPSDHSLNIITWKSYGHPKSSMSKPIILLLHLFSEKCTRFKPAMPIQWPCHLWREEMLQILLFTCVSTSPLSHLISLDFLEISH